MRPNGRWEASLQVAGKRVSRSGPTRREALERLRRATDGGTRAQPNTRGRTVADAIAAHTDRLRARVARGHIKPSTFDWYVRMLRHAPAEAHLDRLQPRDLEKWTADLPGSPSTRRGAWIALAAALDTARRDGLTTNDPMDGLPAPSGARTREPVHATAADVDALLEGSQDPWKALWTVLAYTGLRRGEALALRWEDIDLDRAVLTVRRGKTARARRQVPLVPQAVQALSRLPRTGPQPFPYDGRNTLRAFHRDRPRDGLTIHGLRHGVATRLLEAGTPVHVVSAILGHSSASVTLDTYAHSVSAVERAALTALETR